MSRVYVVSNSGHDFRPAMRWGKLHFLSDGPMNRFSVNNIHRQFDDVLRHSDPDDYILVCGLSIMNMVASSIMAAKHGKINILLFDRGEYVERTVVIDERKIYGKSKEG